MARLGVNPGGPCDCIDEGLCRNELACLAVQDVEKAVFRGLHDHFARAAIDRQIRQNQGLRGVVVPVVSWRWLKVPHQLTIACAERQYGGEVQIVASTRTPKIAIPRDTVACPRIHQIEIGIIGYGVPRRASATSDRSEERRVGKECRSRWSPE